MISTMAAFLSKRGQTIAAGIDYKNSDSLENQTVTHRDILKYGSKIYERKCAELEKLREQSLAELEERIWHLALEQKEQAVQETLEQGQQQLLQFQESAKKEQEKAVKAECKRIEAYMKKQAAQQLQQAEEAFEAKLKDTLHDARIEFAVEKMLAVRQAREEEISHAVEDAARVADLEEKKRKKIISGARKEKEEALKNLKLKMKQQREAAVKEMEDRCQQMSLEELKKCKDEHSVEKERLNREINQKHTNCEALTSQLFEKEQIQRKTERKLREVVHEFQQFIDLTNGFTKGQSEFLLPDINLLQDMLKGAVSSCKK